MSELKPVESSPLCDQMRRAREQSGITVTEAARRSETSRAAIYSYEAGTISPSLETARRILGTFGHEIKIVQRRP